MYVGFRNEIHFVVAFVVMEKKSEVQKSNELISSQKRNHVSIPLVSFGRITSSEWITRSLGSI